MEILTVGNLSFRYPENTKNTLEDISFTVERGDFVCVCGETGSGKTTLLRMLKRGLEPNGEKSGSVMLRGTSIEQLSEREAAKSVGFVMQRPEQQIVTDKVWHELAFGLENLGMNKNTIRARVAETAGYFGISRWFEADTDTLSGGQKQLLNLAAVMAMHPDVLILDEPTAQLDPITASSFLSTVARLNRELALTVIISEHRLEEVLPMASKLLVMKNGALLGYGETRSVVRETVSDPTSLAGMPAAVRLYERIGGEKTAEPPLDIREGREYIEKHCPDASGTICVSPFSHSETVALEFSDVYFRYSRSEPDVLCGLTFTAYSGECLFILGDNGSGKSTALCVAAGLYTPYAGSIRVFGKKIKNYTRGELYSSCLSMLPQDVQTVFLKNTVREELADANADCSLLSDDLSPLLDRHPYDLSGGEQQLVALAKALASKPRLLLLDEPSKGLDASAKHRLGDIIKRLTSEGVTVVAVSHDVEFAAEYADRCAMFFRGAITASDVPAAFFSSNAFYTTAISRMTRDRFENAVTVDDAARLCKRGANGEVML